MKLSLQSKVAALVLLLLPALHVFAGTDNHKGSVTINSKVQVGGTQLQPGDYGLKWDGAGPAVQLSIVRDRKVVATVSARLVELDKKSSNSLVEIAPNADGSLSLTRIEFEGKTYALELGPQTAASDAKSGGEMK